MLRGARVCDVYLCANIFVRDLDLADPNYAACHELLAELVASGTPIYVPTLLVVEVAATISRTRRDPLYALAVSLGLRELPNLTLLPLDSTLAQQSAELAADFRLRGADAVYIAVAQQTGTALVTLDAELRTRAASRITTYTPEEALVALRRTSS